jgi:RNA polymerase sigma factor (TIGR02999 family)
MGSTPANIIQLLAELRQRDETAFEQLAPAVYDRLHTIAESYLRGESPTHSLQATALVNELFLRLMKNLSVQYASREHFYAFAAKLMRRILVDCARKDARSKSASFWARSRWRRPSCSVSPGAGRLGREFYALLAPSAPAWWGRCRVQRAKFPRKFAAQRTATRPR